MTELLQAGIRYARQRGARIVEGYPVEPRKRLTGYSGFTGIASTFRRAGFVEVARRSPDRPIMRYYIEGIEAK
jgi:hypothetical protein